MPVDAQPFRRAALLALLLAAVSCKTGRNYADPVGPRYGAPAPSVAAPAFTDTLRVVSFNIEYAQEMARAIRVLRTDVVLRRADVILLQEMDPPAAKMAADSLGMAYVYYPAIYNKLARKDVGNAVLSRHPIVEDAKLILPSRSRYAKTQRVATAATIRIGDRLLRVYSTHLGTPADLGPAGRAEQLLFIMNDAARFAYVVIGGDMNSSEIGAVARDAGYEWPTESIPKSNSFGRIDHIFLRGLSTIAAPFAGTIPTAPGISDHRPIWVTAVIPRPH